MPFSSHDHPRKEGQVTSQNPALEFSGLHSQSDTGKELQTFDYLEIQQNQLSHYLIDRSVKLLPNCFSFVKKKQLFLILEFLVILDSYTLVTSGELKPIIQLCQNGDDPGDGIISHILRRTTTEDGDQPTITDLIRGSFDQLRQTNMAVTA
jgi:hypothetical protein